MLNRSWTSNVEGIHAEVKWQEVVVEEAVVEKTPTKWTIEIVEKSSRSKSETQWITETQWTTSK